MKKFTSLIILGLMSLTSLSALEPLKVAIMNNSSTAVSVQVKLNDYTGGTATTKYTGAMQSITPNGSGIIIVQVANNVGTDWDDITATEVNSYYVLDVLVGGTLYAQYRLDQLILSQSQSDIYNNNGNLAPSTSGANDLGEDNNRWGELYVQGNTIHIGPDGGMAGTDELAFSYNDATNTATMTVAGTNELLVNSDGIVINGGITANPSGADKDFIFGDDDFNHTSGNEAKMFFDKSKGAFRAGAVLNNWWDDSNVGLYSASMGILNHADEFASFAMGYQSQANGYVSTAIGQFTRATGNYSTSMNYDTDAIGDASFAMGFSTDATGNYSTSMGYVTIADEESSTALGMFNDNTITGELFTVGNGTGSMRSNALEVYKNGEVVIPALGSGGTQNIQVDNTGKIVVGGASPFTHDAVNNRVYRNDPDDDFIFGDDDFDHSSSSEMKMFFDKSKGSFRAGTVAGNAWDEVNIGTSSIALGNNSTASGNNSTALGNNTIASGSASTAMGVSTTASGAFSTAMGYNTTSNQSYSTAMGHSTTASGIYSTAMGNQSVSSNIASTSMGFQTTASGNSSTAMGVSTEASGNYSTALGNRTLANESESVAMGMYNDYTITGELLTIGNGTGNTARTNAFEVYKNGNVVIGDDANATHTVRGIMNMNQGINANGSSSSVAVHFSATAPSSPLTGSLWYDTGASALKIWNGGAWVNI